MPSSYEIDRVIASITDAGRALIEAADVAAQQALLGITGGTDATTVAGVTPGAGGLAILDDASTAAVLATIGGAPLASPTFTGTPAAPTAVAGTNTTQLATTAFVRTEVANLVASAPSALDTLDELAAALGDDASFATTVTTALAGKAPTTRSIATTAPLAGGGDLSADRTLSLSYDGASLEVNASTLRRAALTGDVTASAGSNTTAIANGAVTNAKRADMAAATISGRASGAGTGAPTDLTAAQVKAILALAAGDVSGLATVATTGSAADLTGTLAAARIASNSLAVAKLAASATDVLFGRSTSGAGAGEEIACTAVARTFLAGATTPALRLATRVNRVERTEWLVANNSSTITVLGCASPSATGTPTAASIATTSVYTMQRRVSVPSSASTAGSSGGLRMGAALCFCLGDAARKGGFTMVFKFGVNDASAVANARLFVGLTSSTSVIGNVEPSTLTNIIGVGADMADANLSFFNNDGSGSATKTGLGSNFPANTLATDFYELVLYAAPNGGAVTYTLTNLTTGNSTSATVSSDLPSGTTLLGPQFWRNNGTTALATKLDVGGWVAEVGE